ncbi:MAG: hypothetical protein SEPTF4163_003528 [Sporothrix epigloea]
MVNSAWEEDANVENGDSEANSRNVVLNVGPPYSSISLGEVGVASHGFAHASKENDALGSIAHGNSGVGGAAVTGFDDDAPPVEYRVYKRRWFGLLQLMLLNIIVSWDWLTFSPVVSDAAFFFKTSESTINWLSTAFLFSFVSMTPVAIYVLHFGPRPSMILSAVLLFLGNWIRYAGTRSGVAKDGLTGGHFGVVMFGQILTGLAQPLVLAAPARFSDLWFTNQGRVAATALTSLANPFGAALGQLIVPFWVNSSKDIPNMVLYVSIISTICCVPSFFVHDKPPTPVAPSAETPKMALSASIRHVSRSVEFWLVFIPFAVYVGSFNSISSLLNQFMLPYGYTDDEAGIAGAVLIVVGLVSSAITSPILDRTKKFVVTTKVCVPVIALSYLVFIWMPQTHNSAGLAGPYFVLALMGAASFTLVPVAVEFLVEVTHPVSPEMTSTLSWSGGQLLGGIFIIVSDALRSNKDANPPQNMKWALVFQAVIALAVMPLPLCLGLFGRGERVGLRRVQSDEAACSARAARSGPS